MPRALHFLPYAKPLAAERAAGLISRDLQGELQIETVTLGRGGTWATALAAFWGLRAIARSFDLIHCFDMKTLGVAAVASDRRLSLSAPPDLSAGEIQWLRAAMAYRHIAVACESATQHRRLIERGVPADRCHVIRPAVDFSRIQRRRDTALRTSLGIDEADFVVLAPGESTRASNHEQAVWMGGILEFLDPKYKLLLWGRGERVEASRRFAAALHQQRILRVAEQRLGRRVEFEDLFRAADAIVVTAGEEASPLPIAMSMAAGLPIVSVTNYLTSELLEDRHTAVMVTKPSAKLLARRLLDVLDDARLQWSISDRARAEAFDAYSVSRFVSEWREIYAKLRES